MALKILAGLILIVLAVQAAGCLAVTGSKLVVTLDHTVTPCLPTPSPEVCP